MKNIHKANSPFLNGMITLEENIFLIREYEAARLLGMESHEIRRMCEHGKLPYIFDNHGYCIFLDHRQEPFGAGGKYTLDDPKRHNFVTSWKGIFTNPPGRYTCPTCCQI